ncbi:hypothetical protein D9611_008635 [Ephemerocybe angulata]|uniref:Ndc10 domain-containing protein n=1 Tax=Ephemerocybe angulata TaxID=980116 RepID=A0A8H5B0I6_9AGAR|nr:hypothetical protein D9611_008635 [Tulosesus angulatus]
MTRKKTFQGDLDNPGPHPRVKKRTQTEPMQTSGTSPGHGSSQICTPPPELDMHGLIPMPPADDETISSAELGSSIPVPPALQAALDNPEVVSGSVANSTLASSLLTLEEEAAQQSLARNQEMTSGKGTEAAYGRQIERYETQWALREARRANEAQEMGLEYTTVPAHPITPMKVAIYAEEERKRERLDKHGNPIPNTCISWRTLTQSISALENYRFTHQRKDPRYTNCPEAQISLRDDPEVRSIEKAARQWDAQRQDSMQELKANGVQSQTFTEEQFHDVSVGLMSGPKATPVQMVAFLRDRTMLLTSGTMALRGDNVRAVRLSDITSRDIPLVNIAHDFKAKAIIIFSNQGKTNVNGRIDEHSAFRHREPELCMLDALGMYFFALYHIEKRSPPDFSPDWKHEKATQVGYRDWYNLLMFPGGKSDYEEMNDAYHRKRVNHFKAVFDIFCDKATHGGRVRAANAAIQNGATVDGTKALGNWSQSGSFRACYNRVLPTDAMLALAGFNGERKDSYFIARDELTESEERGYARTILNPQPYSSAPFLEDENAWNAAVEDVRASVLGIEPSRRVCRRTAARIRAQHRDAMRARSPRTLEEAENNKREDLPRARTGSYVQKVAKLSTTPVPRKTRRTRTDSPEPVVDFSKSPLGELKKKLREAKAARDLENAQQSRASTSTENVGSNPSSKSGSPTFRGVLSFTSLENRPSPEKSFQEWLSEDDEVAGLLQPTPSARSSSPARSARSQSHETESQHSNETRTSDPRFPGGFATPPQTPPPRKRELETPENPVSETMSDKKGRMPAPYGKNHPMYDPEEPGSAARFFEQVEMAAAEAGIADDPAEVIKWALSYLPEGIKKRWALLAKNGATQRSFAEWRAEVMKVLPRRAQEEAGAMARLDALVSKWSRDPISRQDRADFFDFSLGFLAEGKAVGSVVSNRELVRMYLRCLTSGFREKLQEKLTPRTNASDEDPYLWTDVAEKARELVAGGTTGPFGDLSFEPSMSDYTRVKIEPSYSGGGGKVFDSIKVKQEEMESNFQAVLSRLDTMGVQMKEVVAKPRITLEDRENILGILTEIFNHAHPIKFADLLQLSPRTRTLATDLIRKNKLRRQSNGDIPLREVLIEELEEVNGELGLSRQVTENDVLALLELESPVQAQAKSAKDMDSPVQVFLQDLHLPAHYISDGRQDVPKGGLVCPDPIECFLIDNTGAEVQGLVAAASSEKIRTFFPVVNRCREEEAIIDEGSQVCSDRTPVVKQNNSDDLRAC